MINKRLRQLLPAVVLAAGVGAPSVALAQTSSPSSVAVSGTSTVVDPATATPVVNKVDVIVDSPEAKNEKARSETPASIESVKARAAAEIAKRQRSLTEWAADIAKAKGDCGQNAGAAARISSTQTALTALGAQIATTADAAVARALSEQITTHHRVYLVVGPAVHLSLACGEEVARATKIAASVAEMQANIAANPSKPGSVAALALLSQIPVLLDAGKASAAAASLSAASLVPDLGNEAIKNANAATVKAARDQVKLADDKLDAANKVLKDARKVLSTGKAEEKKEKNAKKDERKAEEEAKRAEKEAARKAKKAEQEAERVEKRTERETKKADRPTKK